MDKLKACKELGATYLFVGDDWYGNREMEKYEERFAAEEIKIIYFPYNKRHFFNKDYRGTECYSQT